MTPAAESEVPDYAGFRDLKPDGIIEQPFWERYNSRLEMPISFALAVLLPVLLTALVIFFSFLLPSNRNTAPVAMTYLDGDDDKGLGSPGSGGEENPLALGAAPTQADIDKLPREVDIHKVKEEIQNAIRIDGATDVDISDATAAAIGTLHEEIRRKIAGQAKGSGRSGSGGNEGTGSGVGGTGADSTRARALRWVIKFDTRSGKDYLDQIAGLGGIVLLQLKDDNKRLYIFRDPRNPRSKKIATDADYEEIAAMLRFEDIRRPSVEAVAEALGLDYTPPMFIVFFAKELEAKLDKLERQFQNKDPKEIRETTFRVIRRGGEYDLMVTGQVLK